jgi:2,4-dienoyl-CoA reductase-like NADH-dependent reductase (Old Yellow Enzyme family)/thioredoxin reductase
MSEDNFPSLFQPIQIGPMRLRNRIVMPAMSTNFADPEYPGFVSVRHKSYYGERARGGTALIITERVNISPSSSGRKFGLDLSDDRYIPGFRELAESIREHGARCVVQLGESGRIGGMKVDVDGNFDKSAVRTGRYFAASPFPHPITGTVAQELSHRQLEEIAGYFADAADRAKRAGFDAVELHGAHGYLLNEFLSPYSNKRTDQYGGDIEGRSRFPLEVVSKVKEKIGDRLVLSYRISVVEFVQGGLDINESILFAKKLEQVGVQIIHVSAGLNETLSAMNRVIPPMSFPRGRLIDYAEQIKKEVKLPVIVVQRINTPELADRVIREGKADLVATGRALISDPHWPLKAREGKLDEIRRCVACNQGCMEKIVMENSLSCLYNPVVGYEHLYGLGEKAERKKKVLVVGGGVAGMEAAYVAAKRGHTVRLIEKEDQLGGVARVASVLKEKREFSGVIEFLENQLKKLKVGIKLGEDFSLQSTKEENADEIIVATGSSPMIPRMNLRNNRYTIRFAKDVLENPEGIGRDIFILGGGSVGIEVAEYLYRLGKKVTVIEMLEKVCGDLGPLNRIDVLERIDQSPIELMLKTLVLELNDEGIKILKDGKEELLKPPDTVVIAMGAKPNPISVEGLKNQIHYIGDCKKVGNAMDAIHDAFHTTGRL